MHRSPRRLALPAAVAALAFAGAGLLVPAAPPTVAEPGSTYVPLRTGLAPVVVKASLGNGAPIPSPSVAPAPAILLDLASPPVPDGRPEAAQPEPAAGVQAKPTPTPTPRPRPVTAPRISTRHALSGRASWYCRAGVSICMAKHPDRPGVADMYAAAGPRLRRAICGSDTSNCWRGRRVTVNGVIVVLADWCQCYKDQAHEKIIDLYWDAWTRVPHVTSGVTIRW